MIQPCWSKLTIVTIAIVLVLSFGNGFCFVEGIETDDAPIVWFCDPDALQPATNVFRLSGGRNGQRLLPLQMPRQTEGQIIQIPGQRGGAKRGAGCPCFCPWVTFPG